MINHPITFNRDFRQDFSPFQPKKKEGLWEKCQRVVFATLPLLSLHRPFRGPLSFGLSGLRSVTHFGQMLDFGGKGNLKESAFHLLQASLATVAVGLFFFNPVLCFLSSSLSDAIGNTRSLVEAAKAHNLGQSLEALCFLALDLLFIVSLCYGMIEITVACLALQIMLGVYLSFGHFKNGRYLEGVCQGLLTAGQTRQIVPQTKLLIWTWKYQPVLEGEVKQDERGFVYLDIPDDVVYSLNELFKEEGMELPPYFGKGRAGAHVSLIEAQESGGLRVEDVGKKLHFRIVSIDSVTPLGFKGVKRVYYLTLSCEEAESMRMRYGFSPKINGHDFHLTFGVQRG